MTDRPLLEIEEVTVRFSGLVACDAVNLTLRHGGLDALVGPNGAGKTTLFNVLSGLQRPENGTVRLDGREITPLDTVERARLGVARTFQNLLLVPSLSALENVAAGAGPFRRAGLVRSMLSLSRADDRRVRGIARAALGFVGLTASYDEPVSSLPYGERRKVEIARAIASAPRVLLLDEPAAGLTSVETDELAAVVRRIRDELATAVLVVEHDMGFVRTVAERTTVLDFGTVIATGDTRDVLADPRVANAYLGSAQTGASGA